MGNMKISILGMGYVGAVCSACLSRNGHEVIGVDIDKTKVDILNEGRSPIIEKDLEETIASGVDKGLLSATTNSIQAVQESSVSIICVGTPSNTNGSLNLDYIKQVCKEIGLAIKDKKERHVVVMRSTVLPGTGYELAIPTIEKYSGKKLGEGFGYVSNPEFLRESTAIYDFYHPPKTIIGESDVVSGDLVAALYQDLDAPLIRTEIPTAEMVKYADNSWHATKVSFGNEIGNIAKELGIDGQKVMDIFCKDIKLNLSPYYLRPGYAFGGSCLPKDVRAITYKAKSMDINTPLLSSLLASNEEQIQRAYNMIKEAGRKKVGILGLSFKAGTDDVRESPQVTLVELLIGKGYSVKIYDRNVKTATITGGNKEYLLNHIPHVSSLLTDHLDEVLEHADVLVVGNNDKEFISVIDEIGSDQKVIDLIRISEKCSADQYQGICW